MLDRPRELASTGHVVAAGTICARGENSAGRGARVRIAVFGLGYVGCVSAACFAARGHDVVGVEINPLKRELINRGQSPVLEPGLAELIADAVAEGRLRATDDAGAAVRDADLSLG